MKATFTSGKRKKSNYKLSNIKLNCEDDELIIISSLSNLKKKQNLEKFNNLSSHDFTEKVGGFGDCHLFNSFKFDQSKLSKEERKLCYHSKDQIYLFDNDEDGMLPNIHKIVNKSNILNLYLLSINKEQKNELINKEKIIYLNLQIKN